MVFVVVRVGVRIWNDSLGTIAVASGSFELPGAFRRPAANSVQ